jgi:hypothetical protein
MAPKLGDGERTPNRRGLYDVTQIRVHQTAPFLESSFFYMILFYRTLCSHFQEYSVSNKKNNSVAFVLNTLVHLPKTGRCRLARGHRTSPSFFPSL